jgi:hypothetical protein
MVFLNPKDEFSEGTGLKIIDLFILTTLNKAVQLKSSFFIKNQKQSPRDGCHHGEDKLVAVMPIKLAWLMILEGKRQPR